MWRPLSDDSCGLTKASLLTGETRTDRRVSTVTYALTTDAEAKGDRRKEGEPAIRVNEGGMEGRSFLAGRRSGYVVMATHDNTG